MGKNKKFYPISNPPRTTSVVKKEEAEVHEVRYKKNQATINYGGVTLNIDIPELINRFKGRSDD